MIERPERQIDGVREGGRRRHHAAPRGHAARPLRARGRARRGLPRRAGAQPAHAAGGRRPSVAGDVDLALCMTVNPGWGGQAFLPRSPAKLERLRAVLGPTRCSRSTAGSPPGRRRTARQPVRRCSSPAPRCSARTIRARRCARSRPRSKASRPGHTRGTCRTEGYGQPYRRVVIAAITLSPVGPRVLIVDDHPSFRASARVLLEAEGFDVVGEAADGAQALTEAGRLSPEVVLLDVQLPDIDGFDVAARLTGAADAPDRDPRLQPRRLRLRPARHALGRARVRAQGRAVRRPRPGAPSVGVRPTRLPAA